MSEDCTEDATHTRDMKHEEFRRKEHSKSCPSDEPPLYPGTQNSDSTDDRPPVYPGYLIEKSTLLLELNAALLQAQVAKRRKKHQLEKRPRSASDPSRPVFILHDGSDTNNSTPHSRCRTFPHDDYSDEASLSDTASTPQIQVDTAPQDEKDMETEDVASSAASHSSKQELKPADIVGYHGQKRRSSGFMELTGYVGLRRGSMGSVKKWMWMDKPCVPGCPAGLEYLSVLDDVILEHLEGYTPEALDDYSAEHRYVMASSTGEYMYYAAEESSFCQEYLFAAQRNFAVHIVDRDGKLVLKLLRDQCISGCCWCAFYSALANTIVVETPLGTPVGFIQQAWSLMRPIFTIQNENHEKLMVLKGPMCVCQCPGSEVSFNLYTVEGDEIGTIAKRFGGVIQGMFKSEEAVMISFPKGLDINTKATLMGALFLVNMMYYRGSSHDDEGDD